VPDVRPVSKRVRSELRRPKKGDWVRFQRDARLVIAEVFYVMDSRYATQGRWVAVTDHGEVCESGTLEIREAK